MIEKECCTCKKIKTEDKFGKDKRSPTGLKSRCRNCEREYMREYQQKNRKELTVYMRQYRKSHVEELKEWRKENYKGERKRKHQEYNKQYRSKNKERRALHMKRARESDPEKYREINRKSYHKHKNTRREKSRLAYRENAVCRKQKAKEYRNENIDKVLKWNRDRRIRKAELPGSHTLEQWDKLCSLFNGKCARCGKKRKLTVDHIIPIGNSGSSDWITNIQPLCRSCNSSKNCTNTTDYRPENVRQWAEEQMK